MIQNTYPYIVLIILMDYIVIIGLIAATCTTAAFVPQAIKTIKTRETKDLSLGMYLMFTIGVFLWLVYGIFIKNVPIIAANVVTLMFTTTILFMIVRFK